MAEEGEVPLSQDAIATLSGPALAANKFWIQTGPSGVLIAFSEQALVGMDFQFRGAVILSYPDAIDLKNILTEALARFEQHPEHGEKPKGEGDGNR